VARTYGAKTEVLVFREEGWVAIVVHGGEVIAPDEGKEREPMLRPVRL
jgi:hypothetical protein